MTRWSTLSALVPERMGGRHRRRRLGVLLREEVRLGGRPAAFRANDSDAQEDEGTSEGSGLGGVVLVQ
jgi:hypothetical protein